MTAKKAFTNLIAIFAVSILILEQSVWAIGIPLSNPISVNQIQNNLSATKATANLRSATKSSAGLRPSNLRETFEKDLRRFQKNPTFESGNLLELSIVEGQKQSQKHTIKDGYDDIYQLTDIYDGTDTISLLYDSLGNRSTVSDGMTTTTYTPNSLNQYTAVDSTSYSYDNNGNLQSDGINTYTYDYENRLSSVLCPPSSASYQYDAFGRRVSKTIDGVTTYYIYDGANLIAEYNSSGTLLKKYVYGNSIDEVLTMENSAGDVYYYHDDALNSVTEITDSSGAVVESYKYDAFGTPTIYDSTGAVISESSIENRFLFTGREYDSETGLYFYRARTYSPELGRFLQTDPIGYYDSMNLYSYVNNSPLNFVDPWGLLKGREHEHLTEVGMSHHGNFTNNDIETVAQSNSGVDMSHFFDDEYHYTPGTEIMADKLIDSYINDAVNNEIAGNHQGAMESLGIGMHIVQDKPIHGPLGNDALDLWIEHIVSSPDDILEHPDRYFDAYENTKEYIEKYLEELKSRKSKGCKK